MIPLHEFLRQRLDELTLEEPWRSLSRRSLAGDHPTVDEMCDAIAFTHGVIPPQLVRYVTDRWRGRIKLPRHGGRPKTSTTKAAVQLVYLATEVRLEQARNRRDGKRDPLGEALRKVALDHGRMSPATLRRRLRTAPPFIHRIAPTVQDALLLLDHEPREIVRNRLLDWLYEMLDKVEHARLPGREAYLADVRRQIEPLIERWETTFLVEGTDPPPRNAARSAPSN